jgi:hypothetical protein
LVVGHHGGSASSRGFEGVREIFLALFFQKRKQKTIKILTNGALVFLEEVAAFKYEDTFAVCY